MGIYVLGVCGSPIKGGNTEVYLKHSLDAAAESGAKTELVTLAGKDINECKHCNYCVFKQKEGDFCAVKDDMSGIFQKVLEADALLVASPTYLGRLSGLTALFLDRLRVFAFGKHYGGMMKDKVAGALAVSWMRIGGTETTLLTIDYAFLALEMIIASVHHDGVLFGAGGYSSIHGTGAFDPKDKTQVLSDEKGLKGASALAKRAVKLAELVKAGKKALKD